MSEGVPTWVQTMRVARLRPSMFISWQPTAHLGPPFSAFLRAVWELKPWRKPRAAAICVSPHQFHLRLEAGPLATPIQKAIPWAECDHLLWLRRSVDFYSGELSRYVRKTYGWADFGAPLNLAERGALAIRTDAGLWCQTYEHGWPKVPPFLLQEGAPSVGLMVAAALSPEWFTGLPYTPEAVQEAIPEIARPHVTVEWYPEDDLVPACEVDPRCLLHAENIERWL